MRVVRGSRPNRTASPVAAAVKAVARHPTRMSAASCVASDDARSGIRCNAVCLGIAETPLVQAALADPAVKAKLLAAYPLGSGTPQDVARVALYLASDDAAWVTGGMFPIDGGMTTGTPLAAGSP